MSAGPIFSTASTLWVIHIGDDHQTALRALEEGFVCIGWTHIGDLSPYDTRPKMRAAMEAAYPSWTPRTISSSYGQAYRFAHEMKVGEPVVFPVRPTGEIAIGRTAGEYHSADDDPALVANGYSNVRSVDWLKVAPRTMFSQAALHSFGSFLSVSTSNDYLEEVQTVLQAETIVEEAGSVLADEANTPDDATAQNLFETAAQETEDYLLKAWQGTGAAFEEVVGAVFEALGYTATVTQASGDHGVDVIAHPDALGLERPYIKVQVKSGAGTVGEPEVNQLRGLLNQGEQGVLVSLGKFAPGAKAVERGSPSITLIGPKRFVKLFLDHYGDLAPEWRTKFPLKQVFVPFR